MHTRNCTAWHLRAAWRYFGESPQQVILEPVLLKLRLIECQFIHRADTYHQMVGFADVFCGSHGALLLIVALQAVVCQVGARPFLPYFQLRHQRPWASFVPDPTVSEVSMLRPSSNVSTRASCPPFNASVPQTPFSSFLENQAVDCGGYQDYAYNFTGPCSQDVFFMVVLTVLNTGAPFATVDVTVRSPYPINSTMLALPSPSRKYYIVQALSTCTGT